VQTPVTASAPSDGARQDGTGTDRNARVYSTLTCSTRGHKQSLYFIENEAFGLIKIGVTGLDVEQRRLALERGCGVPLRLLAVVPNGGSYEQDLHFALSNSRALGEWFRPTPELRAIIANPETILEFIAESWPHIMVARGLSRPVVTGMVTA
jgi:hypothetical protein